MQTAIGPVKFGYDAVADDATIPSGKIPVKFKFSHVHVRSGIVEFDRSNYSGSIA